MGIKLNKTENGNVLVTEVNTKVIPMEHASQILINQLVRQKLLEYEVELIKKEVQEANLELGLDLALIESEANKVVENELAFREGKKIN